METGGMAATSLSGILRDVGNTPGFLSMRTG
jgi:hypothetical protein